MTGDQQSVLHENPRVLADLINYQEGAVVSRTFIDKKVGTVTLFAFDAGQGLSEHTAPFDAMVYAVEGDVEITIAHKPHHLHAGEIIIMPANKQHSLSAKNKFKMLLIMIRA
ncbi:MAG: cupin domain-containing protein [Candidatus Auribacterota bacterium]